METKMKQQLAKMKEEGSMLYDLTIKNITVQKNTTSLDQMYSVKLVYNMNM